MADRRLVKDYCYKSFVKISAMARQQMPFLDSTLYKCMETPSCHNNRTKMLVFIKIEEYGKAYMINISIKSQVHRTYAIEEIIS